MTLQQAIDTGLAQNRQYKNIIESLEYSELDLETAREEFRTRFSTSISSDARLGTDVGQTYNLSARKKFAPGTSLTMSANSATFGDSTLSEVSVQLSQPLLQGRGSLVNTMGLAEAEWNNNRRLLMKEIAAEELIANIINAYYQAVRQQKNIEVHEKNLERVRRLAATAQAKLKTGRVSQMDVLRAEIQASQAEDSMRDAESALEQARDQLRLLLGLGFDRALAIEPNLEYKEVKPDLEVLQTAALENRLELTILQEEIELCRRRVQVALDGMQPPLNLTMQVSQVGQGMDFSDSMDLEETRVGIGLSANTDLFINSGRTAYRKALLACRGKHNDLEQKRTAIINEVREAVRQLERGVDRIGLRARRVGDAEKQVEFAGLRYEKGLIDNLAVIDAEKELVDARTGHLNAVIDHILTTSSLYRATGRLREQWQVEEDNAPD